MTNTEMLYLAKQVVVNYFNETADPTYTLKQEDTYIVWFSKTLGNWKALVGTVVPDGMYYEVTYDGNMNQIYLDAYKKWQQKVLSVVSEQPNLNQHVEDLPQESEEEVPFESNDMVAEGGEEDIPFQEESEETTNQELEKCTEVKEEV